MNPQISRIYTQTVGNDRLGFDSYLAEKFALLIVQECAGLCDQAAEENARTFYAVTETQEVGPVLVARGGQVQAEKLAKEIREHFGIEP